MPCFGCAGTTTPGSAPSTPAAHEPSFVFSFPFSYSAVFSPRYQRFPAESCAYQSYVSSNVSPFLLTRSWTTRASIPASVFVWFVTVTSTRCVSPFSASRYTQWLPGRMGQYGLSMFVVKSAGSSFTGFVPWGRLDALDDFDFDPPPPQAASARTAIATAIERIMRLTVRLPRERPMRGQRSSGSMWRSDAQSRAQRSAVSINRPRSSSSSCSPLGSSLPETSIRTCRMMASECALSSCRSSATIVSSVALSRSALASVSISAGVASRPANMPKLTRISSAGGSKVLVAKASAGSFDPIVLSEFPIRRKLILARDPAEVAQREQGSGDAPDEDHSHVLRLVPDLGALQHHVSDQVDEVRQRQHVGHLLEHLGEVLLREERARDERH